MREKQQDLGKEPVDLLINHKGQLLVNIRGLGSFTPDFRDGGILLEYIGHAAAVLGTDFTTRVQIETAPKHWKVHHFDSKEGILDVEQINGELITPLDDDSETFERYMGTLFSWEL